MPLFLLVFEQGLTCQGKNCQRRYLLVYITCQVHLFTYFNFKLLRKPCQGKTCQGELVSVYSRQVFLGKCTCQGKLANVNEA